MNAVIVGTSSWVDYFKGEDYSVIDSALSDGRLYLPPIVVAELASGQISAAKKIALIDFLKELPLIEVGFDHWIRVGELRQKAAAKGRMSQLPTPILHSAASTSRRRLFRKTRFLKN